MISSLAEFCEPYETVELWFDLRPNAQLQLIWLLDYFRLLSGNRSQVEAVSSC